jgi:aspartate racemase
MMHKRIGILGGTTPESTLEYYRTIVHRYTERFGDHSYPEIIIYSVSFQQYIDWMEAEAWDQLAEGLIEAGHRLEAAGADLLLIATNTMHLVFDQVAAAMTVPMVSLLDAVGDAIEAQGWTTVGLLGSCTTMEKPFYRDALAARGIDVLVPGEAARRYIDQTIFDELSVGNLRAETRAQYLAIIDRLVSQGAEAAILGCTEIPLLVTASDTEVPLIDTTAVHAEAALQAALRF